MANKKSIIKNYLEDWQYYQHMEEFDKADEIEEILLKEFNVNMDEDWEYWLVKFNLIMG